MGVFDRRKETKIVGRPYNGAASKIVGEMDKMVYTKVPGHVETKRWMKSSIGLVDETEIQPT
jgi:hypothetical protein